MLSFHYNYRYGIMPIIPIIFKSLSRPSPYKFGIIDTGASYILINSELADYIELQRSQKTYNWESASGKFKVKKAKVDLIFGHANRKQPFDDVEIYVSLNEFPKLPLIGRHPLFKWYNVNLDNVNNKCHLIPK